MAKKRQTEQHFVDTDEVFAKMTSKSQAEQHFVDKDEAFRKIYGWCDHVIADLMVLQANSRCLDFGADFDLVYPYEYEPPAHDYKLIPLILRARGILLDAEETHEAPDGEKRFKYPDSAFVSCGDALQRAHSAMVTLTEAGVCDLKRQTRMIYLAWETTGVGSFGPGGGEDEDQ